MRQGAIRRSGGLRDDEAEVLDGEEVALLGGLRLGIDGDVGAPLALEAGDPDRASNHIPRGRAREPVSEESIPRDEGWQRRWLVAVGLDETEQLKTFTVEIRHHAATAGLWAQGNDADLLLFGRVPTHEIQRTRQQRVGDVAGCVEFHDPGANDRDLLRVIRQEVTRPTTVFVAADARPDEARGTRRPRQSQRRHLARAAHRFAVAGHEGVARLQGPCGHACTMAFVDEVGASQGSSFFSLAVKLSAGHATFIDRWSSRAT